MDTEVAGPQRIHSENKPLVGTKIHPATWMVVAAVLVRVFLIYANLPGGYARIAHDHYWFGFEAGRVAQSIYEGRGFSSPFPAQTGPTAWLGPIYPSLIAASFGLFKPYSPAAYFVMLFINSIFSALTCLFIYRIAEKLGGKKVAFVAGWLWVLVPYFSKWATTWVWEISLSAFFVSALVWLSLRLDENDTKSLWISFAAVAGIAALTNPAILAIVPALATFPLWRKASLRHALARLCLAAGITFAIITPWLLRNHEVFHRPVFIRSNFWFEFYLGNSSLELGFNEFWKHPSLNPDELTLYSRMGEVEYIRYSKERALAWVKRDPTGFLRTTGKRIVYYWTPNPLNISYADPWRPNNLGFPLLSITGIMGALLAWTRRVRAAFPIALTLVFYPIVYYLTYTGQSYRHPIEPELLILSVWLVAQAQTPRWMNWRGRSAAN